MPFALSLLLAASSAQPALPRPAPASLPATPAALELFERDWVLMNWALKYFDSNGDMLIEPSEAQAAARAFRKLADTNGDGRVSPQEYEAARALILEHY
ncbi:MAG TPA: hypothetical protein VJ846_09310 [Sphingomicrobium sp.]|nr:hypothetical protein [Sphingomicrobium sp.]